MKEREGLFRPDYCPRKRKDCESLSQIISGGHGSFICCGENKARQVPQDKYRICWKNGHVDEIGDYDKRDIIHMASVLLSALALIEEEDCKAYHDDNA